MLEDQFEIQSLRKWRQTCTPKVQSHVTEEEEGKKRCCDPGLKAASYFWSLKAEAQLFTFLFPCLDENFANSACLIGLTHLLASSPPIEGAGCYESSLHHLGNENFHCQDERHLVVVVMVVVVVVKPKYGVLSLSSLSHRIEE